MGKHILGLEVRPTTNEGVLLIDDISVYDPLLPVTCPNLQITPPGYTTPASLEPADAGFRLTLSTCAVGLSSPGDCASALPKFPDGIYNIRYSVSPNDKVYVEYKYLRTTAAMNRYYALLCALNIPCCLPDKEMLYYLQSLDTIRNFILSAQITVEQEHNFQDGINQLRYANALMDKMRMCKPFCSV